MLKGEYVYIVRRNDPLDHEIDVFDDFETAQRFAHAADGHVTDEPILHADDEYVLQYLLAEEAFDAREPASWVRGPEPSGER
jgi:hypothetical protein